jgi:hypothetical protein
MRQGGGKRLVMTIMVPQESMDGKRARATASEETPHCLTDQQKISMLPGVIALNFPPWDAANGRFSD